MKQQELTKEEIEQKMARQGSYSKMESRIDPINPEDVSDEVREIFDEYKKLTGRPSIPITLRVWANIPMLLRGRFLCLKAVMFEGVLPKTLKDSISILIAKEKGCKL
jgi:hypothetical protein